MEKKVSQFLQSDLPSSRKLKTQRSHLIMASVGILLLAYLHKDHIFQILLLAILGAILSLPGAKWGCQAIEKCLREGKTPNWKNLKTMEANKKALNYLLIFFGIYLIIVMFGLIFPEKMSSLAVREFSLKILQEIGNIGAPYVTPPSLSPLRYKLATFTDVIFGTMYYLLGGIIGGGTLIYLWVRKLPK